MQTGTRNQLELETNTLRNTPVLRRRAEDSARAIRNEDATSSRPELRSEAPDRSVLTAREQDIMHLLARGQSVTDIAEHLGVSTKTVRNNLCRIFPKLGAHRQAEAILVWLGHGVDI